MAAGLGALYVPTSTICPVVWSYTEVPTKAFNIYKFYWLTNWRVAKHFKRFVHFPFRCVCKIDGDVSTTSITRSIQTENKRAKKKTKKKKEKQLERNYYVYGQTRAKCDIHELQTTHKHVRTNFPFIVLFFRAFSYFPSFCPRYR